MKSKISKATIFATGVFFSAILIFMVFLCPLLLIPDESINKRELSEIHEIKSSGSGSQALDFGYYLYSSNYVGYRIRWSFESSNSEVGITVLVMEHDEFNKYKSSQPSSYYTLSDGTHVSDSGAFEVPSEGYWVIMLINADPAMQQTTVTYEISIEHINPMLIIITVITVIGVVAVVVTIVFVVVKKRKPKHALSQSISPPQSKKDNNYAQIPHEKSYSDVPSPPDSRQNWLFCPHCGKKSYLGAQFCVNCGRELKNQNM